MPCKHTIRRYRGFSEFREHITECSICSVLIAGNQIVKQVKLLDSSRFVEAIGHATFFESIQGVR